MDDEVEPTPEEAEAIRLAREENGVILHEDLMLELSRDSESPKWATQFVTIVGRIVEPSSEPSKRPKSDTETAG